MQVVGNTTSGAYGYNVRSSIAMAYVPAEIADRLARSYEPQAGGGIRASSHDEEHLEVELLGERCSALVLNAPPVKPDHLRRRHWQSPLPPAL